ncbi:21675_t:CDS:2, partial [Cetraspora pellucida]
MKRSHYGGKPSHSFTPHIKIIHAPNSKTVYAICKWCEQKHDIVQQPMQLYLAQEYSLVDISHFEKLVLNATIENGWSFNWVEKESSITMLKFKYPNLVIPSHTLGGHILKDTIQELHSELITKATHDIVGVSLAFDRWKNILKQNIFGTILITSSGEVLIWSVQDISAELERTTNVISKIEVFLEDLKTQQIKVGNTRWNSFYEAFSCLLCSKASLISLIAKYTLPEDNSLALPNYICETISD